MLSKEAEWQRIVEEGGGVWGKKSGLFSGAGIVPDLVMFDEPLDHSSVTLKLTDLTVENVRRRIAEYAAEAEPVTEVSLMREAPAIFRVIQPGIEKDVTGGILDPSMSLPISDLRGRYRQATGRQWMQDVDPDTERDFLVNVADYSLGVLKPERRPGKLGDVRISQAWYKSYTSGKRPPAPKRERKAVPRGRARPLPRGRVKPRTWRTETWGKLDQKKTEIDYPDIIEDMGGRARGAYSFFRKTGGVAPDDLAAQYEETGVLPRFKTGHPSDWLMKAIIEELRFLTPEELAQPVQVEELRGEKIPVGNLDMCDVMDVHGIRFKVVEKTDEGVVISNGAPETYEVFEYVEIDPGTLKKAAEVELEVIERPTIELELVTPEEREKRRPLPQEEIRLGVKPKIPEKKILVSPVIKAKPFEETELARARAEAERRKVQVELEPIEPPLAPPEKPPPEPEKAKLDYHKMGVTNPFAMPGVLGELSMTNDGTVYMWEQGRLNNVPIAFYEADQWVSKVGGNITRKWDRPGEFVAALSEASRLPMIRERFIPREPGERRVKLPGIFKGKEYIVRRGERFSPAALRTLMSYVTVEPYKPPEPTEFKPAPPPPPVGPMTVDVPEMKRLVEEGGGRWVGIQLGARNVPCFIRFYDDEEIAKQQIMVHVTAMSVDAVKKAISGARGRRA